MSEFKLDAKDNRRVIGLDIARSVAILAVVVHHFTRAWWHYLFAPLLFAGIYGVELFFVLSGYLIGGILFKQAPQRPFERGDVLHFWIRRWFRTLPNYVLFLGLSMAIAALHGDNMAGWWRYLFFLQNFFHFHITTYGVSWSLCVEEWAYIALPLLYTAAQKMGYSRQTSALLTTMVMILCPMTVQIATSSGRIWDYDNRFIVVYRISAIGIGVLLAYISIYRHALMEKLRSSRSFLPASVVLIGAVLIIARYIPNQNVEALSFAGKRAILMNCLWFIFVDIAMLLVVAALSKVRLTSGYAIRFFTIVSQYSYSVYLCHVLIQDEFNRWRTGHGHTSGKWDLFALGLDILLTCAVSYIAYNYYERPMTNFREKFRIGRSR